MDAKRKIEIIECNSVNEAELEYFKRRSEGCWQMVKCMEIVWSWKKFKTVVRFSMKKVDNPYHFDDFMKDTQKIISYGLDVAKNVSSAMGHRNKAKLYLQSLNKENT